MKKFIIFTTSFILIISSKVNAQDILSWVINQNVTIESVDDITDVYYPRGEINACSYFYMKLGSLDGEIDHTVIKVKKGKEEFLQHEIGHIIDCYQHKLYFWSSTDTFKYIYQLERYNNTMFFYGNGTHDEHEYFAESYNQYMNDPKGLKKYNPLTYDYIQNTLKLLPVDNYVLFN